MNRKSLGDNAELQACRYLQGQGLQLLQRNYRCRGGEIDLVMQHGDSLVFVEVRFRTCTDFGAAAETVSAVKQRRVIHCARVYIQRHRQWDSAARFDVVSIEGQAADRRIEWIADAFRVEA